MVGEPPTKVKHPRLPYGSGLYLLAMLIEVYADIVCPWCFIGQHRLKRALALRPQLAVERTWLPFELNPEIPPEGIDRTLYLAAKFGGLERARQIYALVEETAARDGLVLHLDRVRRTPNTLDAHRLIALAARHGQAEALIDTLFRAYFQLGLDIGDREVLTALAAEAGLDPDEASAHLASDADRTAVRAIQARARQLGIHAVPTFIFERRYALAGAQDPATLLPLLDLAWDAASACVPG